MKKSIKELIKNALILFAITLCAGFLLGVVYEVTKAPRAEQKEKQRQQAFEAVFEDADSFENYEFDEMEVANALDENGISSDMDMITEVVSALNTKGEIEGYVITVTSKEGYGGDVVFTVGIQNDGTVNGISFLTLKETAGLGMKAKDDKFKTQFENKCVDYFEYTKTAAVEDNQVDAITGATITTNAVTNGVNSAIYCFDYISELGGDSIE